MKVFFVTVEIWRCPGWKILRDLINGGCGIRMSWVENFLKINKRGGGRGGETSIRDLRVAMNLTWFQANWLSCIDFIFTNQRFVVTDCGAHSSLHSTCHHQITCCKLKLQTEDPPPYQHLVWNLKETEIESIRKVVEIINWESLVINKNYA